MKSGTERQEKELEKETERRNAVHAEKGEATETPLTWACRYYDAVEHLKKVGLLYDCLGEGEVEVADGRARRRGMKYEYGTGWVVKRLPKEVVKRIKALPRLAEKNGLEVRVCY